MDTLGEPIEVNPRFIRHIETVIQPIYQITLDKLVELMIEMIEDTDVDNTTDTTDTTNS